MRAKSAVFLILALAWFCEAFSQPKGAWSSTGSMTIPTAFPKSVALPNGKVLITGGASFARYLKTCEIYNPATGVWTETDSLNTGRYFHTITLLKNGKVLVTGGAYALGSEWVQLSSCEIYDTSSGHWSSASPMNITRCGHTATLLRDGRVLVTGGNFSISSTADQFLNSCEIYDPQTDQWILTDTMSFPRRDHTTSILPDGRVLVVGGFYAIEYPNFVYLKECEVYDPATGTWSITDSLHRPYSGHASVTLQDSTVLVIGGQYAEGAQCERFSPQTMSWSQTGSMHLSRRDLFTATVLPNGKVLAAGGTGTLSLCELYDPADSTWAYTDPLPYDVRDQSAVLLDNGKALLSGGYSYAQGLLSSCLLFDYTIATAVEPTTAQLPRSWRLDAYPNPFNPSTTIRFSITSPARVRITIYSVLGKTVKVLLDESKPPGAYEILWDGKTSAGAVSSSGMYFCSMDVDRKLIASKRLLLLR